MRHTFVFWIVVLADAVRQLDHRTLQLRLAKHSPFEVRMAIPHFVVPAITRPHQLYQQFSTVPSDLQQGIFGVGLLDRFEHLRRKKYIHTSVVIEVVALVLFSDGGAEMR